MTASKVFFANERFLVEKKGGFQVQLEKLSTKVTVLVYKKGLFFNSCKANQ